MQIQYNGEHSIDFMGDLNKRGTRAAVNTWRDLHLVPSKKPYVAVPEATFNIVTIPGTNKALDLTNYLYSDDAIFSLRKGDWEFIVDVDGWGGDSSRAFAYFYANFHGKRLYCELQDDPGKVYFGRFIISDFSSEAYYPVLKMSYTISSSVNMVYRIRTHDSTDNPNPPSDITEIYCNIVIPDDIVITDELAYQEYPLYDNEDNKL